MFYKNILVPIDNSHQSKLAFQKALKVADNQTHLHLVHVIDTRVFDNVAVADDEIIEKVSNTARKKLEEMVTIAEKANIPTDYSLEFGSPKLLISKDIPQNEHSDLIIMGATGMHEIEKFFLGSVAEYVAQRAVCDVLIVRN